jgi:hypothetical protein
MARPWADLIEILRHASPAAYDNRPCRFPPRTDPGFPPRVEKPGLTGSVLSGNQHPIPSATIIRVDLFGNSDAVDTTSIVLCGGRSGSHCLSDNDDG